MRHIYLLLLIQFLSFEAYSQATGQAFATMIVRRNLEITTQSNLNFGSATIDSSSETIDPSSDQAAKFLITGEADTQYSIILPKDGQVVMTTGTGETELQQIPVSSFTSNPAEGSHGILDSSGTQDLGVGATRAPITDNHESGNYQATFTIIVVY